MSVEVRGARALQQLVGNVRASGVGIKSRGALFEVDSDAVNFVLFVGLCFDNIGERACEIRPVNVHACDAGRHWAACAGDDAAPEVDDALNLEHPVRGHDARVIVRHLVEKCAGLNVAGEDCLGVVAEIAELGERVNGLAHE